MNRRRFIVSCILLCIPTAILIGIGVHFVVARVPQLERNEARRVSYAYRSIAEELAAHPETADYAGARKAGWRPGGKIGSVQWGRLEGEETSEVWCRMADGKYISKTVDAVEKVDFALVFYAGGGVVALIIVLLTAFGVGMLVRLVRERDDFLAATAHDLTTPLVGMRYAIGRDEEEVRRLNERMVRLVDNVKDFMKLGGRRRPPKPAVFDLAAACREAYGLFREDYRDLFDGKDVEISGKGDLTVFADETMTVQILWNLFGNDLKYAAPYGSVRVALSAGGGMVRAAFVDEGQGMTQGQMKRAFDRYYRAKTVLESGKGGFGIGLCTAREFARAMGGDLVVEGNAPKGCVFTLSLPAWPHRAGAAGLESNSLDMAGKEV